ncbi:MAG: transketolase [Lachnospiraceae bacterium]|jgi:transketolase|nr:transketolase [Lachnospiraceae bacterium]
MDDEKKLKELRKKIFLIGCKGGMAHLASCYSCLEILYALYVKGVLKLDAANPKWSGRDRFILSKGHAGLALYTVMAEAGLLSWEECASYMQPGGGLGGEPCMRDSVWVEATTGSLGHGLPFAQGMAMALKAEGNPARVFVLLGDGECEEGSVWEAAMTASAFGLERLTVILDCNEIQKMDFVNKTIGEPVWREKWSAFGWQVDEVDGHDIAALERCLQEENHTGKPRLVIAHTVKGKGVSIMENNPNWHFKLPSSKKEWKVFREELGISEEEMG